MARMSEEEILRVYDRVIHWPVTQKLPEGWFVIQLDSGHYPDCEDRCQILEHKGYHTCAQTGRCEMLEAAPLNEKAAGQSPVSASAGTIGSNGDADRRGYPTAKGNSGDGAEAETRQQRSATFDKANGLSSAPAAPDAVVLSGICSPQRAGRRGSEHLAWR